MWVEKHGISGFHLWWLLVDHILRRHEGGHCRRDEGGRLVGSLGDLHESGGLGDSGDGRW